MARRGRRRPDVRRAVPLLPSIEPFPPSSGKRKSAGAGRTGHNLSNIPGGNQTIPVFVRDGSLHRPVANFFQGRKLLGCKPDLATGKAGFWFHFCHAVQYERRVCHNQSLTRRELSSNGQASKLVQLLAAFQKGVVMTRKQVSSRELVDCPQCLICGGPMQLVTAEEEYSGYSRRTFECRACSRSMTEWIPSEMPTG